ncbi:MAG: hypothetical protein KJO21_06980 [Verrucomicrobiae bacterium]|nr:hypothetical protein [Verrucomicrobiae bacterium]NNJ43860.1 hypothetical protein [Akkermansiaceae bacterium]
MTSSYSADVVDDAPVMLAAYYDGLNGVARVNGGALSKTTDAADGATFTINEIQVGRDNNTPRNYQGEMIVLNTSDLTTIQKVEGYLAWKWGMQAKLPAAHPYSTTNGTSGPKKSVPSATVTLAGTVTDSDDTPSVTWSDTGDGTGTGTVIFEDVNDLNTDVSFYGSGTYILRLTVDDGHGPVFEEVVITVSEPNNVPSFTADPIAGSGATEDIAYSATLAGSASDDDAGATLSYAKVDGPDWLSIASDGTLSGTPGNSDIGANSFTVSVTDGIIPTPIEATLDITVNAASVAGTPIFIDLSSASAVSHPAGDGKYWNALGQADGSLDHSVANVIDVSNASTTIGLAIDLTNIQAGGTSGAGFGGTGVNGPSGADPFDEAAVITDGIFNNNANNGTAVFSFTGLAADTSYAFSAIGGRASNGDDGQIIILDAAENKLGAAAVTTETTHTLLNDGTVLDFSVTSNASGEIFFEFRKADPGDTDGSATINGLSITSASPADTTAPTLASADIVDDQGGSNINENDLVTYTVTFSEDMDDATVTAADFSNAGSASVTIGTISETSPGVFSVEVTPTNAGTLQLQVPAGASLSDAAGNALDTASAIIDDTTITVSSLFESWAGGSFNFETDTNNDGVSDGLAFLLGANDLNENAASLIPAGNSNSEGNLVITFNCLNADNRGSAVINIQFSNDIGVSDSWADHTIEVPETSSTVNGVVFTITPNGTMNEVQAVIALSGLDGLFSRVQGLSSP